MCDTMVVLASASAEGRTLLAKNSDREPNEAQYLTSAPRREHAPGSPLRCTYIEIPQVARTHAILGSRPWWMWGFEHGVNEHNLAIGNEAVWARLPASTEPGLLGMDLVRLGLERAADADEALEVITGLLATFGQSGRASATRDFVYHNSFILADPRRAWILETAGPHWVAKRVGDVAAISNVYSIGSDYDRISPDAIAYAAAQGWYRPEEGPFDFAAAYTDRTLPALDSCRQRYRCSSEGLRRLLAAGLVALESLFALLRNHDTAQPATSAWRPGPDGESALCMHASKALGSETAASMVAELPEQGPLTCWVSLASPCLSSFVPLWLDSGAPTAWMQPAAGARDAWWELESLQRRVERDYPVLAPPVQAVLAQLERRALDAVRALPPEADICRRATVTREAVEGQAVAIALLSPLVRGLAEGPLVPLSEDPRGRYLDEVQAIVQPTARSALAS